MFRLFIGLTLAVLSLVSTSTLANSLTVSFELPSFDTSDYNKPYVAIWAERPKKENETLLLWHLTKRQSDKWLVDIRRWWRKMGRYGDAPDGVTGATKGPGKYTENLALPNDKKFTLYIEVVREDGGRTLLKQKIDLNKNQKNYSIAGGKEIGDVSIQVKK